jgi:hypothetical protein
MIGFTKGVQFMRLASLAAKEAKKTGAYEMSLHFCFGAPEFAVAALQGFFPGVVWATHKQSARRRTILCSKKEGRK